MKRVKLKNLFICFISAVFMLLAEGCSKDSNCDLEIKRQAQSLTTLKVGLFFLNYSLDPKDYFNGWILVRIGAGETLLTLDDAGKLQPNLISGYRILDDKTYELTMRNDVAFSDGTKLDADMVKRNLERIFTKSPRAIQYFDPEKIIADNTANTVTIYTKKPVPEIFYNLCEPLFAVIKLDKENEAQTINIPITTGPYQVTKFVPNERISVKPNPNYRNQSSDISQIDFYYIPDAQSRLIALKAGDLDIINTVDHSDLQLLKQDKNMQVLTGAGPRTNVIYLNHLNEFLKDNTLRKAINLAINRENIVKLTGGAIAKGVISYHFDFGKKVNAQKFDPKLAKTLLDRAGFIDTNNDGIREMNGKNIELTYRLKADHGSADSFIIAQCVKEDLKNIGILVNLVQTENLSALMASGDFDLCSANDSAIPTGDCGYFLTSRYKSDADANFGHYKNKEVDKLLDLLNLTFDLNKRTAISQEIANILNDDVAALYISYPELNTVCSGKVKNMHLYTFDYYLINDKVGINDTAFTNK